MVYDKYGWQDHPLYPAGEFYGEFATFDVTLDLAEDQVIGATGVPVEGDPGWERAKADPGLVIDYQRDWYWRAGGQPGSRVGDSSSSRCGEVGPGRKCVRFYAEQTHHFAFSLNPRYVYEQGRAGGAVVRVLYLPGDSTTWGNGVAVRRTETALAWLDMLFGRYQWPQLTNLHRIEGGGTEFPMVLMDGSASMGLIVHEAGHQYTMGQLANNEWRDGWLDEGFTSFQSGWFVENQGGESSYPGLEADVLWFDLHGWSEPVAMVGDRFNDFTTYGEMTYSKAQLFYEQLRYVVGDERMHRILRTYFDRWKLKHVDETAFRSVAEEVSGQDLGWLFGQWLHGTVLIDYRLRSVARKQLPDGRWRTTVTIERRGDGWMPVEIADPDTIYARATGQPQVERIEFTTARRPGRLMLDPRGRTHDWNMLNNRESRFVTGGAAWEWRLDNPTREMVRRDRLVSAWMPTIWSNDFGGVTVGLRQRSNYFGTYNRSVLLGSVATAGDATDRLGVYFRISDPLSLGQPAPRLRRTLAAWAVEGRAGVAVDLDRSLRRHLSFGSDPHVGFDALWMATSNQQYLDDQLWDNGGTIEAGPSVTTTIERGATVFHATAGGHGGVAYWNPGRGLESSKSYDLAGFARLTGEASVRAPAWLGTRVGLRLFGGAYLSGSDPLKQRRIMVAGADPYQTFTNPFVRSEGALFVRPGVYYHSPGGAGLRAFRPDLGGRWAVALNAEISRSIVRRERGAVRDVALEAFVDFGLVDSVATTPNGSDATYADLHDSGIGVVTRHQVGDLAWTMRFEFPIEMNEWTLSAADPPSGSRVAFRWVVSLSPSF